MTSTATSPPEPLTHGRVLVVFSGLLLAMLLAPLDQTIVATALPTIVGELGGLERLSWVVTSYLLAQTVVTPLYGKLGDLYGRKGILQGAVVLFLIGSALCGLSRSMMQLIAFRAVQGLGGGGLMVTTMAVVGARRAHIESVFGQWTAEEREELAALFRRVSRELVPDARVTGEHHVVAP